MFNRTFFQPHPRRLRGSELEVLDYSYRVCFHAHYESKVRTRGIEMDVKTGTTLLKCKYAFMDVLIMTELEYSSISI